MLTYGKVRVSCSVPSVGVYLLVVVCLVIVRATFPGSEGLVVLAGLRIKV